MHMKDGRKDDRRKKIAVEGDDVCLPPPNACSLDCGSSEGAR